MLNAIINELETEIRRRLVLDDAGITRRGISLARMLISLRALQTKNEECVDVEQAVKAGRATIELVKKRDEQAITN